MKTGRPKSESAKHKSITVRLPDDIHQKLIEFATKHNVSKTEVVLRSLADYFSKQK